MSTTPSISLGWGASEIKGLLIVAGVLAGIGITGFLVYKGVKNYNAKRDSKAQVNAAEDDLAGLIKNGVKPTLSNSQLQLISNNLFTAMNGYGTNEDAVIHEFAKINNEADMLALIKTYGTKTLSSGSYNPAPNFTGSLTAALAEELSDTYIAALNGLLSRKGIKNRI